jgi:hypothetical protein
MWSYNRNVSLNYKKCSDCTAASAFGSVVGIMGDRLRELVIRLPTSVQ